MKKFLSIILAVAFALSFSTVAFATAEVQATGTVVFKYDNGQADFTKTGEEGSACAYPAPPTKDGYDFAGWNPAACNFPTPSGSQEVWATWTLTPTTAPTTKVTIKFDSNYGSAVSDMTGAPGDYLIQPTPPTRSGYYFLGWKNIPDGGDLPNTFPMVTVSTTYWYEAQWQMVPVTDTNVTVVGSTEPIEAWLTFAADELQAFIDSPEAQSVIDDFKTALKDGDTNGLAAAVDGWVQDFADENGIDVSEVKQWLADNLGFLSDWYIPAEVTTEEVTLPETEPETEPEVIPQTGSAMGGIAIFATLSLAAAAAFVCTKKR